MFLHTVRTGLRDDSVKSRVEGMLKRGTSDEDLFSELNTAALEEEERKLKRKSTHQSSSIKKSVTINEASIASNTVGTSEISEIVTPMLDTMCLMRGEIKSLRADMNKMKAQRNGSGRGRGGGSWRPQRTRGCDHCKRDGKASTCRHCWNCGSGDHMSYDCRSPLNN